MNLASLSATAPNLVSPSAAGGFTAGLAGQTGTSSSSLASRDTAMSELPDISSAVNLLAQAATAVGAGTSSSAADAAEQLTLPPLPQMPAPAPAPAVPHDDNGQSNVVLQDSDSDASLIH